MTWRFRVMLGAVLSGGFTLAAAAQGLERPNVVILFADDLGYGELGCQGNPQIPTPHIDSIARNGVRFTSGYSSAPYCSPSRAGLMTGRYQTRFGYELNPVGAANDDPRVGLPVSEATMADHLRDAGYTTGLVGKWHLGGTAAYHPLRRGFDEFFGFLHEGHFYVPPPYRGVDTLLRRKLLPDGGQGRWTSGGLSYSTEIGTNEPPYDANNPILRGGQPVEESAYLTDAWTREAIDFIERNADRPFFLYVAHNAVHSPMQGLEADVERFASIANPQRRVFAAMLSRLDQSVGAVLGKLDEKGLTQRTLVFFISDNGGPTRELTSSNAPLRGQKGDMYEGGIRVPFLMQWPGQVPAGQTYDNAVITLDVFPTAAAAAGAHVAQSRALDGVDLLPYLRGERPNERPHETLYWRLGNRTALRQGDWKLVRNARQGPGGWELYDLAHDLSETTDLAPQEPARLAQLMKTWTGLNAQMAEAIR